MVLEKFHEIPFTNKKVACRRQAMQRVEIARVGNTVCHRGVQETEALRPLLMLVDAIAAFT